jgi:hypothetical protein
VYDFTLLRNKYLIFGPVRGREFDLRNPLSLPDILLHLINDRSGKALLDHHTQGSGAFMAGTLLLE